MLFLDRKKNQSIELYNKKTGEVVHVIILDQISSNVIRLGFEDPSNSYTILRKEVRQRNEGAEKPNPFFDDRIPNSNPSSLKAMDSDPLMPLLNELLPPPTNIPSNVVEGAA